MGERKYPEHNKMRAAKVNSQAIGEFIEWAQESGMTICEFQDNLRGGYYHPTPKSIEQLLADFFGINLMKVGEEKDAMVVELRGGDDD